MQFTVDTKKPTESHHVGLQEVTVYNKDTVPDMNTLLNEGMMSSEQIQKSPSHFIFSSIQTNTNSRII